MHQLYQQFVLGPLRQSGPFTVQYLNLESRQPAVHINVTVRGSRAPGWDGIDEQIRTWLCEYDGRDFMGFGGIFVMHLTDQAGASRTVTITGC